MTRLVIAAPLLLVGCGDDVTTLHELRDRGEVRAVSRIRKDVCRCPCDGFICVRWFCGSDCSTADEVSLKIESGADECIGPTPPLTAKLAGLIVEPLQAYDVDEDCAALEFIWRAPPAWMATGLSPLSRSHVVELTDDAETWRVENPFVQPVAEIIAPDDEADPAPEEDWATIRAGGVMSIRWSPQVRVAEVEAWMGELSSGADAPAVRLAVLSLEEGSMELAIPADAEAGEAHAIALRAEQVVSAEACQGPTECTGFALEADWVVHIE